MKIQGKILTMNDFSRPGKPLQAVKGIVIHWVGNPGTTAEQNRDYFESLKKQKAGEFKKSPHYASAHFIIGLEGEMVQCLLENEVGYHVGAQKYTDRALRELSAYPNNCTIGIELCHTNWDGEFTPETLKSAKELIRELCERHNLGKNNIYRHYDITGKDCSRYFVINPEHWINFLDSLEQV
jgi:N-acetylmuramoyl-L-alanine amidase